MNSTTNNLIKISKKGFIFIIRMCGDFLGGIKNKLLDIIYALVT